MQTKKQIYGRGILNIQLWHNVQSHNQQKISRIKGFSIDLGPCRDDACQLEIRRVIK
jgi:hypothetical protein